MQALKIVAALSGIFGLFAISAAGAEPPQASMASYGNPRVQEIVKILGAGARPKYSPDGQSLIFDRRNTDGHYDLYISNLSGQITASLTAGQPFGVRHSGNGIYDPTFQYIAFIAQEPQHYLDFLSPYGAVPLGEPGVGLFNNLWITNGLQYWRVTNVPIKQSQDDGIPVIGTVNPRFAPGGSAIIWTERYEGGGTLNWGLWRLKAANLVTGEPSGVALTNEKVIFTPAIGNYVTAMDFISPTVLLVAGNLDGQHQYGMDLYRLNLITRTVVNLTNSPTHWEEGSCVAPSGKIVYMTNRNSGYAIDFNKDWVGQPVERDYWIMNGDGTGKERLTYFNDPAAAEYTPYRSVSIICDVSPDGKTIAATIGRDYGDETLARVHWQIWLIKLHNPL